MNELNRIIDNLTSFGTKPNSCKAENLCNLKVLLIDLYRLFLHVSHDFDSEDYPNSPEINYNTIRKNVTLNFPELGYYHSITESYKVSKEPIIIKGDAVDDLTDIIIDVLDVRWRMDNTSVNDALWHFDTSMKIHSEQHLVNLLTYLKDKMS